MFPRTEFEFDVDFLDSYVHGLGSAATCGDLEENVLAVQIANCSAGSCNVSILERPLRGVMLPFGGFRRIPAFVRSAESRPACGFAMVLPALC